MHSPKANAGPAGVFSRLRIESLEMRCLLNAAGLASQIAPLWFQNVAGQSAAEHAGTATWTAEDTIATTQNSASSSAAGANLYDWIVSFDTASLTNISSVAATASLLAGGGIDFEVLRGLGLEGVVLVRSSGASLGAVESWLAGDTYVASFEEDAYRAADSSTASALSTPSIATSSQWDLAAINASLAWTMTTGSSNVVVAVIDTGVDYNHVDLSANIWTNANAGKDGFVGDLHGYNFVSNNGNPMDDNGHGTHVAGTIAAEANNYGVTGVAYSTTIMPLKFLNANGSGYLSDAISAINYATMERTCYGVNVRVDNCSWGGGSFSSALQNAIAAAGNAGILVVTAAGNSGTNNDASPEYPANYDLPNVISVAASTQTNQLASFSNYGATTVDIAAPGVSIYSTTPNNTYSTYSGTSMATPHVSAVAALAWALDPNATVAEVRNAILQGADHVASLSGKLVSGGVLDAYSTLKLLKAGMADKPVVGSLVASSSSVTAGATVNLTAGGIADAGAKIASVRYVLDANNNGTYDSGDRILGTTSTIAGGAASVTLSTTGYAAGTYHVLADAQNSKGNWSDWVATTVTVLPADDYGDSAATAAAVGAPASISGTIGAAGDKDWFKFQAAAGKAYVFTVGLGTLRDSVLYLYDTNGQKQLAFNDDYGGTFASQIAWTAPTNGSYYLVVAGYGNRYTGTYALSIALKASAASSSALSGSSLSVRAVEASPTLPASQSAIDAPTNAPPYLSPAALALLASADGDWLGRSWDDALRGTGWQPVLQEAIASAASLHDEVLARLSSPDVSPFRQEDPLAALQQRLGQALMDQDGGVQSAASDEPGAIDFVLDSLTEDLLPPAAQLA